MKNPLKKYKQSSSKNIKMAHGFSPKITKKTLNIRKGSHK